MYMYVCIYMCVDSICIYIYVCVYIYSYMCVSMCTPTPTLPFTPPPPGPTKKHPSHSRYLDVSHGGWLGWEHSMSDYLDIIGKARHSMNAKHGLYIHSCLLIDGLIVFCLTDISVEYNISHTTPPKHPPNTPKPRQMNVVQHVRGFATNTANYQSVGKMCPQWDWCLGGKNADDECVCLCLWVYLFYYVIYYIKKNMYRSTIH